MHPRTSSNSAKYEKKLDELINDWLNAQINFNSTSIYNKNRSSLDILKEVRHVYFLHAKLSWFLHELHDDLIDLTIIETVTYLLHCPCLIDLVNKEFIYKYQNQSPANRVLWWTLFVKHNLIFGLVGAGRGWLGRSGYFLYSFGSI